MSQVSLLGGRLALDLANLPSLSASGSSNGLSWEELIGFLQATQIVSPERGEELLALTESDPQSAFESLAKKQRISRESVEPVNEILRVTEGHDELVESARSWRIEYVARESSL